MPKIAPFTGIRYRDEFDASAVTCPPYDVISAALQRNLVELHPRNFVHLVLPPGGDEKYEHAAAALRDWQTDGTLVPDPGEAFYLYCADYLAGGEARTTAGLIGALALEQFGEGGVFPHENTMPGPKADRLALMHATNANLEPLWFVAAEPIESMRGLVEKVLSETPLADLSDIAGVRHRLWSVEPSRAATIAKALSETPVVIADGHHRYETALTYRDERRARDGAGGWDSVLAMVVDPVAFAPALLPIHRIVRGERVREILDRLRPAQFSGDIHALAAFVSESGSGTIGIAFPEELGTAGVVLPKELGTISSEGMLDSEFLGLLLAEAEAQVTYEHDLDAVMAAVASGATAFIMAPVPLALVLDRARSLSRMPPKTTLFWPKPRSGLVLRLL